MVEINRKDLVEFHNVKLNKPELDSPLTVGNGSFAYTFDITGMQTLYNEYLNTFPLCTMAEWGWHTIPADNKNGYYSPEEIKEDEYPYLNRTVSYPVTRKPGNEDAYDWLRENPHKYNLARVGLFYKDNEIKANSISDCRQELNIYEGVCSSEFILNEEKCKVTTYVHSQSDTVCFRIDSKLLTKGLEPRILLPYPSCEIHGSDWSVFAQGKHTIEIMEENDGSGIKKVPTDKNQSLPLAGKLSIKRVIDNTQVIMTVSVRGAKWVYDIGNKIIRILPEVPEIGLQVTFSKKPCISEYSYDKCIIETKKYWEDFWEHGGILKLRNSIDSRAVELERRIILSMYLMAVQCTGTAPPQETGLTLNSWYGKFHLEMYLWHQAFLPLWNRGNLLKKSLPWFKKSLKAAESNAAKNGYKGARWPKMIAETAIDSPSPIASLLVWQQPHIIYMLELCYSENPSIDFLNEHEELVTKTAEFLADFCVLDEREGKYHLIPPLIPAQECHNPMDTKDPSFEVEYFVFGMMIATDWYRRLNKQPPPKWLDIIGRMTESPVCDGKYQAHSNCKNTFATHAVDHPSMLCMYGLINNRRIDKAVISNTLKTVIDRWDYDSLWGWDFAVMSMTAARLGLKDLAIDLLLTDTPKNRYVKSGNNAQGERKDLPLYLPGNGSLLLAIPLLAAGIEGMSEYSIGFPDNENWEVEYENINPFPW